MQHLKDALTKAGGVGAQVTDVTGTMDGVSISFDAGHGKSGQVRVGYPTGMRIDEATVERWATVALASLERAIPKTGRKK